MILTQIVMQPFHAGMEAEEEALEVAALRMGEVHGMIRPCAEEAEELRGLSRIPDGAEDDLLEEFRIDRVRAGEGGQNPSFAQAAAPPGD